MIGFSICLHRRTSFPISPPKEPGQYKSKPYVICLSCGKAWEYDWERMKRGKQISQRMSLDGTREGAYSGVVPLAEGPRR